MPESSPRLTALKLLSRIERDGAFSNLALNALPEDSGLSIRDRRFVWALVCGVTERRLTLEYFIRRHCEKMPKGKVLSLLRMGFYQLYYMDTVPQSAAVNETVELAKTVGEPHAAGFVNAVMRAASKVSPSVPVGTDVNAMSVRYSVTTGLVKSLIRDYGKTAAEGILNASFRGQDVLTVRVNTLKTTPETLAKIWAEHQIKSEPGPLPGSLRAQGGVNPTALPGFEDGLFHVQDFSSQLCCLLLNPKPGDRVLDACAAPGGKSFTMAELMENRGEITAAELRENRIGLIESGARRLGLHIINATARDSSLPWEEEMKTSGDGENGLRRREPPGLTDTFQARLKDKILCDVPCSGFGILRKKPEIRYKNVTLLDTLPEIQYRILRESSALLGVGGRLIYSTCTLRREENENVCLKFLKENPHFAPLPIARDLEKYGMKHAKTDKAENMSSLLPQDNQTDGFFIAGFQRN
ncbi:MAG: 16S rRNA (cytosine(967)-C(5))-methyltransferase RsmB [Oscillospiraceae bacterium]|nr:16S rRNA (cytosine(967)-C(5))-methyltransferase RsmB [Oscillospiraceae bacterium]